MNELHTYCFYVDGMRMLDPSNVYMIRDIATYTNYFLVDGEITSVISIIASKEIWQP